jgi:hypothetical protein
MRSRDGLRLLAAWGVLAMLAASGDAHGHGSVVAEDDRCLITMGYLQGHFKIYLPQRRRHTEYCEDLPATGEAVFVMEYLHDTLSEMPIDFRIIRNETGKGRFARLDDLGDLTDLDRATVFHQPASVHRDVFTVVHDFTERGQYVGIVLAAPPGTDRVYTAVFPFRVGVGGFGFWPWFALFLLIVGWLIWQLLQRE